MSAILPKQTFIERIADKFLSIFTTQPRRVYFVDQTVSTSGSITSYCADITVVNKGVGNVQVNARIMEPGDSFTDSCYGNEFNDGAYTVKDLSAGAHPIVLIVTRKYYRDVKYNDIGF
jgi:hypothetical protein